jgi:hypothetical protein
MHCNKVGVINTGLIDTWIMAEKLLSPDMDAKEFLIRVGTKPPLETKWITLKRAAKSKHTIDYLLNYVGTADRMLVRMETYDAGRYDVEFNIKGIQEAAARLRIDCAPPKS